MCKRALLTRPFSKFLVGGTCAVCWRVLRIRAYIHTYIVRITQMCYVQMHRFTGRLSVVALDDLGLSFTSFFQMPLELVAGSYTICIYSFHIFCFRIGYVFFFFFCVRIRSDIFAFTYVQFVLPP